MINAPLPHLVQLKRPAGVPVRYALQPKLDDLANQVTGCRFAAIGNDDHEMAVVGQEGSSTSCILTRAAAKVHRLRTIGRITNRGEAIFQIDNFRRKCLGEPVGKASKYRG